MSRTPGPWKLRRRSGEPTIEGDHGGTTVAIVQPCQYQDAAFIVEACNSYDHLRELANRTRMAEVDGVILRGLVTRILDGPKAGLTRDARAWLGRPLRPKKR